MDQGPGPTHDPYPPIHTLIHTLWYCVIHTPFSSFAAFCPNTASGPRTATTVAATVATTVATNAAAAPVLPPPAPPRLLLLLPVLHCYIATLLHCYAATLLQVTLLFLVRTLC